MAHNKNSSTCSCRSQHDQLTSRMPWRRSSMEPSNPNLTLTFFPLALILRPRFNSSLPTLAVHLLSSICLQTLDLLWQMEENFNLHRNCLGDMLQTLKLQAAANGTKGWIWWRWSLGHMGPRWLSVPLVQDVHIQGWLSASISPMRPPTYPVQMAASMITCVVQTSYKVALGAVILPFMKRHFKVPPGSFQVLAGCASARTCSATLRALTLQATGALRQSPMSKIGTPHSPGIAVACWSKTDTPDGTN